MSELPANWKMVRLGEHCKKPDYGLTATATMSNTGIRFVRITDIQEGGVNWQTVPFCTANERQVAGNELVDGDIVVARIGATTGKAYLVRNCPPRTVFASYLIRLRVEKDIAAEYLNLFLQTTDYWEQVNQNKGGRLMGGMSIPILQNLILPLPPLLEQQAITATLRAVQEAYAARRRELAAECERKAALMEDLFTFGMRGEAQKETVIGPLPQSWEVASLGNLINEGPKNGLYRHASKYGEGIPIVRINDFDNEGQFVTKSFNRVRLCDADIKRYGISVGDLLINRVNSLIHIGKCALVLELDEPTVFDSNIMRFRVKSDRLLPDFLRRFLTLHETRERIRSIAKRAVAQSSINQSDLRGLFVPVPPLGEQQNIIDVLAACDSKIAALETEAALHDELFRALLDELVSGRLSTRPLRLQTF